MGLIGAIVGGISDANKLIKQSQAQKDDTTQNVVVPGKFSIDVPSFLSPMKNLNEDASLQYGSRALDISFIVIDESKKEFVDSLAEVQTDLPSLFGDDLSLLGKMATLAISGAFDIDKVEIGGYRETKINGLDALTMNVFQKRTFFKDAVYGSFAFIEGKDTVYQIVILSGGTSIRKLADKLEKSIQSFREL